MTHLPKFLISLLAVSLFAPTTMWGGQPGHKNGSHQQDSNQQSGDDKVSDDALAADPLSSVPVIIQYKAEVGSTQDQQVGNVQGAVRKHFKALHAVAAQVPASALKQLARDANVSYISLDRPIRARQFSTTSAEYTTEPINAPAVWAQGFDGTGIGVAVIDSGIAVVADLQAKNSNNNNQNGQGDSNNQDNKKPGSRVVYNYSFLPASLANLQPGQQQDPSAYTDQYGHGTHVAGLIAGNGAASTGSKYFRTFSGVAPNATLINLRVLDANGLGSDSSVIAAIEAAIALKDTYNIRVINLSVGRPIWESYTVDPLCQAVEAAWKAGIVVVVAAGNDGRNQSFNPGGYGTVEAPGNDPYVITVGAMRTLGTAGLQDDLVASYSSKGPSFIDHVAKPDLVAPGNLVSSLEFKNAVLPTLNPGFVTFQSFYMTKDRETDKGKISSDYYPLSGTSMATGVVSGAVSLLLQAQPQLTPDKVKALLMRNANRSNFPQISSVTDQSSGLTYTAHYDLLTVGAGYLDIQATVRDAATNGSTIPAGTAMSPIATYDPTSGNTYLVTDQTVLWGARQWSASDIYGQRAFDLSSTPQTALWANTVLWGARLRTANDPAGFTVLWGSTVLWGAKLRGTDDPAGFTVLWGARSLWNASTPAAATAIWGDTVLWGARMRGASSAPANGTTVNPVLEY